MNSLNRHVIKLVRDTVKEYSSSEKPNFDEICSGLGLDVTVAELPTGTDGGQKDKTIIINSRIRNEERKRFTQFHEVTHYLIDEDGHLISELHDLTFSKKDEYHRQLEKFCNIGAAEFLMPSKEFTKLYEEKGFNVQLIPFAAKHFRSSTIAATIQLAQVAPNKCIAVICEKGLIPNDKVSSKAPFLTAENQSRKKPKLHVVYSASSPAASNRWLAKYTVFPDDHIINQAFLQSKMLEGECDIPFPGWQESYPCEALPYKNRVYALFHLSPLPNSNQMTLF